VDATPPLSAGRSEKRSCVHDVPRVRPVGVGVHLIAKGEEGLVKRAEFRLLRFPLVAEHADSVAGSERSRVANCDCGLKRAAKVAVVMFGRESMRSGGSMRHVGFRETQATDLIEEPFSFALMHPERCSPTPRSAES
jgi:hypothetical protein